MRIVAIDTGTTNTKTWVVTDGEVDAPTRARAGARDVAGGKSRDWLADQIRQVAEAALAQAGIGWPEVDALVGFGMLTSELGLQEVPHLRAPVGTAQLSEGMRGSALVDDVTVPLYLIPGILCDTLPDAVGADFMRGEETQVAGLLAAGIAEPPLLYVSPGSHTKFVAVGADGRIEWSFTTLSGELVWALSKETILAPLLDPGQPLTDIDAAARGARVARESGLARALYGARLASRLQGMAAASCTDFIRGAIAATDVDGLQRLPHRPSTVVLGAGSELGPFYRHFLTAQPATTDVRDADERVGPLGAWTVYAKRPTATGGLS
jgi:2-dehydro-3-deoxygalactonokinase